MKELKLKVGIGEYEGRTYEYLYVLVDVNGALIEVKLKPYSTFEKKLLISCLEQE